ncbi:MAG: LCP family protein [Ilumatobacteraceae bacterium]|nr:LCP family protein [Ilumatobacteraceae bacterium]
MPRWLLKSPIPTMLLVMVVVATSAVVGLTRAADNRVAEVERVEGLSGLLAGSVDADGNLVDENGNVLDDPVDLPSENYLLVGSDTREGISEDDPDFGVIGDTNVVSGRRADTIMVLRRERDGGAAIVSLPRDLWVEIPGTGGSNRINSAYNGGAERLVATVVETLGIPVHHYVEVNFVGFRDIVNELGGVTICFPHPTRDVKTGLDQPAGCNLLDGLQALAFARSRSYQEFREGQWRTDPTADIGRTQRQQQFISAAADGAITRLTDQPFASGDLIAAVSASVKVDETLDPFLAAAALKQAYSGGFTRYSLPVYGDTVGSASVLRLGQGSAEILDYFRGIGPAPATE